MLGVMLAVPTYATVVTGSQSDVNLELKYPLVYTNNMFAQKAINTDIANYVLYAKSVYYDQHAYQVKQNYKVTYEDAQAALEESLEKLGLDYVDLYLIHWPNPKPLRENDEWKTRNADVWRAMEDLYQEGKIRAIGVSNFLPHHLDDLLETARIIPAVNQVRLAPGVYQEEVVDYCKEKGILLEAWGPFGQGELFDKTEVQEIAAKHGKSVAQIALAWSLAEGFLPLPKSVTASRIQSNLDCFEIELSKDEREVLKTISVTSGAPRVDEMDF